MSIAIGVLAVIVALMTLGLWLCLAATLWHFRRLPDEAGPLLPMTLIKPVRGLHEGMAENFKSIARSDPERALQVIIALESETDPAYPVAKSFAAAHPDRDILVLVTGPHGPRMAKVHNMIEALPRARHPRVIFSDADILTTARLLRGTSRAFQDGCDAAFALPYHVPAPGLGGLFFEIAFNHSFCLPAALSYYAGQFHFNAGGWMAYTKDILARAGGLEPYERHIADDISLGTRMTEIGARKMLVREPAWILETTTGFSDAFAHLVKWFRITRSYVPRLYLLLPVVNLGVLSLLLWVLCEASGQRAWLGRGLLAAAMASRVLVGMIQDLAVAGTLLPLAHYPVLACADLGTLVFWACGFESEISWRGTRYRLFPGGRAEVVG